MGNFYILKIDRKTKREQTGIIETDSQPHNRFPIISYGSRMNHDLGCLHSPT